ncbi:MAG: ROK family protein [Eubacteriaceae bacterium]|jgi:predicted NBD/HSP70 family sugar kinase
MNENYLAIDVGGTAIKYALMNSGREILESGSTPTPYKGVQKYLDTLEGIYQNYAAQVQGIAMSVPGVIDMDHGICVTGGNLDYIENFPLAEKLAKRCGVPVTVMNDAKSAALAEVKSGALSDIRDGIVLVFGTGIGGALIKDGRLHLGSHLAAGEFSFIIVGDKLEPASAWAFQNGAVALAAAVAAAKGMKPEQVSGYEVFNWAEAGDSQTLAVLDRFTLEIARQIVNLQTIYDPERFAIGGGISRRPIFTEYIKKNLKMIYSLFPFGMPEAEVTVCKYHNDANLIGALENYLERHPLAQQEQQP